MSRKCATCGSPLNDRGVCGPCAALSVPCLRHRAARGENCSADRSFCDMRLYDGLLVQAHAAAAKKGAA